MRKTLIKNPRKIPESGKKITSVKEATLTTSNMYQIVESSEPIKTTKPSKKIITESTTISRKQISGIRDIFSKYVPSNITDSDITALLQLRYKNGSAIINEKDKDIIIEIQGMLRLYKIDYVLDFLEEAPNKEWIFWDQEFMNIGKVSVEREIFINRAEEIGVKGVGKCRFCPGTELVYAQKQVNAGDEPMKVYVRCVTCGQHWKQG